MSAEPLLMIGEVAERLRMCRKTAYERRKAGNFPPAVRIADGQKGLRWRPEDVDAWIQSRLEKAAQS